MSTDIRQLKKDNEVFYPQTHIKGVIGLDDELATKANIDGYYESMGVGIADDLKGDIDTPSQFIYRKTGGDTEANTGTANVSLFKGNTVKFNQLVINGNAATSDLSSFEVYAQNSTLSVENNYIVSTAGTVSSGCGYIVCRNTIVSGHIYYIKFNTKCDITAPLVIEGTTVSTVTQEEMQIKYRLTATRALFVLGYGAASGGTKSYLKNIVCIDLTNIFGSGNEPSIDNFEAWLSQNIGLKDYYDYTPGKLLSFGGYSIKWNQLVNTNTTSVPTTSGYKYLKVVSNVASIVASTGSDITGLTGGVDQVFDLTTMFGQGNEPSQTQFEAWFLQGSTPSWSTTYYPYNAGEVKNILEAINQQLGIETVGFNQWDEEWELGGIDTQGNNTTETNRFRTKNYIPIIPSAKYFWYINKTIPAGLSAIKPRYYDANKNYIGAYDANGQASGTNIERTMLANAKYFRFFVLREDYGSIIYNHDICINFSDPAKNNTYEPYQKNTLNLDWIKSLEYTPTGSSTPVKMFPNGLLGAGTVYDEINERQAIKRIGSVDMGTLEWSYLTSSGGVDYFSALISASPNNNIICSKYAKSNATSLSTQEDKTIRTSSSGTIYVYVIDSSYTDATTFKTAMNGVILYYELSTPIIIDLNPSTTPRNLIVDNKGTERLIPENGSYPVTGAFNGNIRYDINAVETLRKLSEHYVSINSNGSDSSTLKSFAAALGSVLGINISWTWDSTTQTYSFTTTDNRVADSVPESASATGTKGTIAYDSTYLYVCVATDTWIRAALTSW